MDTIKTNQIEIGGKLLNIEPKKLGGNVQINLVGDVSGSVDTPVEAGSTINITTKLEKDVPEGGGQLIPPEFFLEENAGKAVVINEAGTGLELAGPFASKEYVDGIVGEVETQLSEL